MRKLKFRVLASGSNGNAAILDTPTGKILIDAGISCKRIINGLRQLNIEPSSIDYILVTHSHTDHVRGLPVLSKYIKAPLITTPMVANSLEKNKYKDYRWKTISEKVLPIELNGSITKRGMEIVSLPTFHDDNGSTGFQIHHISTNITVSIMTDTGNIPLDQIDILGNSDLLLIESNYDPLSLVTSNRPEFLKKRIQRVHLSNESMIAVVEDIFNESRRFEPKMILFGHLSGECNSPEIVSSLVKEAQQNNKITFDWEICSRRRPTPIFELDKNKINVINS